MDDQPPELLEESAEDLYENAPCGYISTLPNGVIVKANQTFLTWLGRAREELLSGVRFQELLSVGGKIFYETHFAPLLQMQGFINEVQLEVRTREGVFLPVLVNTVQRRDAAGRSVVNRITLFNISDRKKYEQELVLARRKAEQAARARSDFLSMVSHEIRTPMNAIIGIASLLQKTELSPQQEKYVRILGSSSENLLGLLNHILDFSKIDAGKVTLEQRSFDLRQLVYGTLFALSARAEEKNLSLIAEIDEQVPEYLVGDPVKLGQVLTNLVGNAIKFTELGAVTVSLRVREQSQDAVSLDFAVTDTGIGIAEGRLGRIFEEFTQADSSIGMKYGGTGLGLSISQKLVELHGGRICVKSTQGQGSTFFFTLRMKPGQASEVEEPAENPASTQSLQGLRILVAEDNDINVFMLSQFLKKWGADFDVVGDGRQAVQRIQEADYDLVLMDVRMPELDGYDATRAIRALHPGEHFARIPIIAVTASTRLGLEHRAQAAGFTDFLGKPYKPAALAAKLVQHSGWKQAAKAQAGAPSEPSAPGALGPAFSLRPLRRIVDEDPQAIRELSALTLSGCEQYKVGFQKALEAGDRESFEYQAHKILPTVELLQAQTLRAAVQAGRAALADASGTPDNLASALQAIHRELDAIISALKPEARRA